MTTKTKLTILATLVFFSLFFYLSSSYLHSITTPYIIDDTIEASTQDKKLKSVIGTYRGYQTEFNVNDIRKDTINFTILHKGSEKNILISYKAKNTGENTWNLISADTINVIDK